MLVLTTQCFLNALNAGEAHCDQLALLVSYSRIVLSCMMHRAAGRVCVGCCLQPPGKSCCLLAAQHVMTQ